MPDTDAVFNSRLDPLYFSVGDGVFQCALCAHGCRLSEGQKGLCQVRICRNSRIESLVYGRVIAENIDPIEKKPLFHILPGSLSFSIATSGCNFRCTHCQNASISQVSPDADIETSGIFQDPEMIVQKALAGDCRSISYTYVEPTIFFEFASDCCQAARENGLLNIFVSNGYMSETVVDMLVPVLTGINIDLKSFSDSFYKKVCGARLQPVLDTIRHFQASGVWVEVTTLVIPGMNDSSEELEHIAAFLAEIDKDIPWHVTGFYPAHRMSHISATSSDALARAYKIGKDQGLHNVYTGNRPGTGGENSYCHVCGLPVVMRHGFQVIENSIRAGCCPSCGTGLAGIWS